MSRNKSLESVMREHTLIMSHITVIKSFLRLNLKISQLN